MKSGNRNGVQWVCVCVDEGGVHSVGDMEITSVRRQIGAAFGFTLTGCNCRWQSNGRWRVMVIVCVHWWKNVFYEAGGSRLFGSRVLLHKIILLLSNLMWYAVNLSSQVSFSHLPSFCFGLFVKSAFAMLRVFDRERMLNEVSQSGPCGVVQSHPKFCWGSRTPLTPVEELSRSPLCKRIHT